MCTQCSEFEYINITLLRFHGSGSFSSRIDQRSAGRNFGLPCNFIRTSCVIWYPIIMKKSFVLILIQLVFAYHSVNSFFWVDCRYDKDTSHVEYTCRGEMGFRFSRRTDKVLYCRNYIPGIDRASVRILSFRGCHDSKPPITVIGNYKGLRVYDLSSTGIESLGADWLENHKLLENFIASYNDLTEIPFDLFRYTPKITALDFSFNQIQAIDPVTFDNVRKLKRIRFGHNLISELHSRLFAHLPDLELIDFRSNRIKTIADNLLANNRKLRSVNFNDNQVKRLDCEFLLTFANSYTVNITLNTLEELKTNCANDRADMEFRITIASNDSTNAQISNGWSEWTFNQMDFNKLFYLNFTNNQYTNISALLGEANTHLFTLDLSNTFIAELNGKTLKRFAYLRELYLSRTNLSNILFGTFSHQTNLRILDISYNGLGQFDFYLFLRNFQNLEVLNLEGNDLTEIESLTRTYFPKLNTLIISNNRLSCDYLTKFLHRWNGLKVINVPSSQVIMEGVHCPHQNLTGEKIATHFDYNFYDLPVFHSNDVISTTEASIALSGYNIKELFVIKVLLISLAAILALLCLCFTGYKCTRAFKLQPISETTDGTI